MCVRWLAESVFLPSQQDGKCMIRSTALLLGHTGYLLVKRFSKPVQVQVALALAGPLVTSLASPMIDRRNCGSAVTLLAPPLVNLIVAEVGSTRRPMLPASGPGWVLAVPLASCLIRMTGQ